MVCSMVKFFFASSSLKIYTAHYLHCYLLVAWHIEQIKQNNCGNIRPVFTDKVDTMILKTVTLSIQIIHSTHNTKLFIKTYSLVECVFLWNRSQPYHNCTHKMYKTHGMSIKFMIYDLSWRHGRKCNSISYAWSCNILSVVKNRDSEIPTVCNFSYITSVCMWFL